MVHSFCSGGLLEGAGARPAHLCLQKAGRGAQASLGAWGQGAPSDVEVSPRGPRWAHFIPDGTLIRRAWSSWDLSPVWPHSLQAGTPSTFLSKPGGAGFGAGGAPFSIACGGGAAFSQGHWLLFALEGLSLLGGRWQEADPAPWTSVPSASRVVLGGELGVPGWWQGCSVAPAPSVTSRSHLPSGPPSLIFQGGGGLDVLWKWSRAGGRPQWGPSSRCGRSSRPRGPLLPSVGAGFLERWVHRTQGVPRAQLATALKAWLLPSLGTVGGWVGLEQLGLALFPIPGACVPRGPRPRCLPGRCYLCFQAISFCRESPRALCRGSGLFP